MATTTNYSWTTPDDTDLVKDGAAAIRTLGSSIDTSFAADEGDLLVGGISDIFEPLAIGAASTVLTSDGTTASWATPSAGGMTLLTTITASAASAISFTSIPGTFTNLLLTWEKCFSSVSDTDFWSIRFNNDTTANRHYQNGVGTNGGGVITSAFVGTTFGDTNLNSALLGGFNATDGSGYNAYGAMTIYNYADAARGTNASILTGVRTAFGGNRLFSANCIYEGTNAIDRIDFIRNSTQTVTGTFRLFGVK